MAIFYVNTFSRLIIQNSKKGCPRKEECREQKSVDIRGKSEVRGCM